MGVGAGHHVDFVGAAPALRKRSALDACGSFFFATWVSVCFVLLFAGAAVGAASLLKSAIQSISICAPLSRGN